MRPLNGLRRWIARRCLMADQLNTTAAAAFLDDMAWQCDAWATESEQNGWSTHQVARNRHWADLCRRKAAELRRGENVE